MRSRRTTNPTKEICCTFLQGEVTSADPVEQELTLDTGVRKVTVEVDAMPYNPLDDVGYQKIKKGHHVSVSGDMDVDFFEGGVFEADTVVTISKKDKKDKDES